MKLCAVAIWYNPNKNILENIYSYIDEVERIYIVDNSTEDNSKILPSDKKIAYIPLLENTGIAHALNVGCEKALADGFDWCMTMDQDSGWNTEELEKIISLVENSPDSAIKSFAPLHRNQEKSVIGDIKFSNEAKPSEKFIFKDKVMTSGNFIELEAWEKTGKFNEKLFIDEVDHEFCYRLLEHGYKIYESQETAMIHKLGNLKKKTFLPRPCKHSGVRLFYIFRNMNYIKDSYNEMFKKHKYRRYMISALAQKIMEFNFKDVRYILQGIKAYRNGIYGSYENFLNIEKSR